MAITKQPDIPEERPKLDTVEDRKRAFLAAYAQSDGCITDACRYADIHPETYYEYAQDEDFRKEIGYIGLRFMDTARKAIFKEIRSGSMPAIKFFFETDGLNNFSDKTTQATLQVIEEDVKPIGDRE